MFTYEIKQYIKNTYYKKKINNDSKYFNYFKIEQDGSENIVSLMDIQNDLKFKFPDYKGNICKFSLMKKILTKQEFKFNLKINFLPVNNIHQ